MNAATKTTILVLAAAVLFGVTACGSGDLAEEQKKAEKNLKKCQNQLVILLILTELRSVVEPENSVVIDTVNPTDPSVLPAVFARNR